MKVSTHEWYLAGRAGVDVGLGARRLREGEGEEREEEGGEAGSGAAGPGAIF